MFDANNAKYVKHVLCVRSKCVRSTQGSRRGYFKMSIGGLAAGETFMRLYAFCIVVSLVTHV